MLDPKDVTMWPSRFILLKKRIFICCTIWWKLKSLLYVVIFVCMLLYILLILLKIQEKRKKPMGSKGKPREDLIRKREVYKCIVGMSQIITSYYVNKFLTILFTIPSMFVGFSNVTIQRQCTLSVVRKNNSVIWQL